MVLARALAQEAPLLLLDEPTSALDAGRQQEALELIDGLRAGCRADSRRRDARPDARRPLRRRSSCCSPAGASSPRALPAEVLTEPLIEQHYGARVRVLEGAVIPVRR